MGSTFGVSVVFDPPEGRNSDFLKHIVVRVTYPQRDNRDAVEQWEMHPELGKKEYIGWKFEHEHELAPGTWIFEILQGVETLARQTFTVRVP